MARIVNAPLHKTRAGRFYPPPPVRLYARKRDSPVPVGRGYEAYTMGKPIRATNMHYSMGARFQVGTRESGISVKPLLYVEVKVTLAIPNAPTETNKWRPITTNPHFDQCIWMESEILRSLFGLQQWHRH